MLWRVQVILNGAPDAWRGASGIFSGVPVPSVLH